MKRAIINLALSLGIIILVFSGCSLERNAVRRVCIVERPSELSTLIDADPLIPLYEKELKQQRTVTIWIHGTMLFSSTIFQPIFDNTTQLKHFSNLPHDCSLYTIATTLITSAPYIFIANDFYVFGWSGHLSFMEREKAAQCLYEEINSLCNTYIQIYGQRPKIQLITHSHGGNVALNLAKTIPVTDTCFAIDQLILLACPVQDRTKHLIHNPIFKQCYSLYSRLDLMQIIDPQGIYTPSRLFRSHFLSERCFPSHDRLHQIKIRMNRRAITHSEFTFSPFLEHLAVILNEIDVWKQQKSFYGNKKGGIKHLLSLESHLFSSIKKRSRRNV